MADRRAPLHGLLPWSPPGGTIVLAEPPLLTQIDLRLRQPGDTVAGIRLPLDANRVAATGTVRCLWLGPDEWLLTAPADAGARLLAALPRALAGRHHAVTDVSAARAAIEISGPQARALLAAGCSLDLHPRVFAPGYCAQTLLARLQVILDQLDASPRYRLFVGTASAHWLLGWLIDAAADITRLGTAQLPM
jgi:sarcosine oxidase, subunit gamma